MTPFLLDTNVIVDALRKRNGRHLLVNDLLDHGHPLASCPITLTEIYAGMRPHEEIAEQAGRLKARYARRGRTVSFQDATIAAVSIAYDCTLVTENIKDFPMPELRLHPLPQKAI